MSYIKSVMSKVMPVFRILFMIIWVNNLAHTDAYFSVYLLIAFFSFYQMLSGKSRSFDSKHKIVIFLLSGLFSIAVILANYPIFTLIRDSERIGRSTNLMVNLINTTFSLVGGLCVANPVISWFFNYDSSRSTHESLFRKYRLFPTFVFLFICFINLIHLFLVEFPGNLTEDTFTQISEMVSGQYSNFNTFWHTMMFEGILRIGYFLFGNLNTAVALFCIFQIMVLAFAFTYCLVTMDRCGVPGSYITLSFLIFSLMPYHMALLISIWKDVLFAGGCLIMISSLLRITKKLSDLPVWDYFVFIFSSLLFLLSRTNGWIIYLVMAFLYVVFYHKNKKLLVVMAAMSVIGWILLNPMLSLLGVSGGDPVESFSVPIQQVSRVIYDGCTISDEDEELLSRVIDLEEVSDLYVEWLSDPMKVEVRSKDYDYFLANFSQYYDLWIRLGMKYPWTYVKAWVDQTKGYWNAGYGYAMYSETVIDNVYGVEKIGGNNPVASLFRLYFGLSRHVVFFEPLHSIGLHVWLVILCFLLNVVKRREEWIISVPVLTLVIGLWFGTPVYACFRYVYPLFVCAPLIISTAFYSKE